MKISLKKVPDPRIEERLSKYVAGRLTVSERLALVAQPAKLDPRINARLRAVTR